MTTHDRKYPHLGANFLKGSVAGQIKSIHRTRETQPEKLTRGVRHRSQVKGARGTIKVRPRQPCIQSRSRESTTCHSAQGGEADRDPV